MNNRFNLKGKTAWITGGKRIGKKIAETLAKHGANVVLSYNKSRKEAEIAEQAAKKFGVKTLVLRCDVSSRKSVENAVGKIKKDFKKIDILVLMASVFEKKKLSDLKEKDFRKNFDVHVIGTFLPIQLSLGLMPRGSHVITVSDAASLGKIYAGYLPYHVAKNAVVYLTKALAFELHSKGIFINCIAPGPILKPEGLSDKYWLKIKKKLITNYRVTDEESVEKFAKLAIRLSTIKTSGSVYKLGT